GGSGFIAGWCVADLLNRGYFVRTTVRSLSKANAVRAAVATVADPKDKLTVVAADLTSEDGWDAAMAGCHYVLHVASPLGTGVSRDPNALIVPARRVVAHSSRRGQSRRDAGGDDFRSSGCSAALRLG